MQTDMQSTRVADHRRHIRTRAGAGERADARGAHVAFVARTAERVAAVAREDGAARHRRRRRATSTTFIASRCKPPACSAAWTCWSTTPPISARRRSRCSAIPMRGLRARARDQRARTVPADEGAARLAGCVRSRGPRQRRAEHFERRRSERVRALGRIRLQQGCARAHDAHLERGDVGAGREVPRARSGRHGHADACARRAGCRSRDAEAAGRRRASRLRTRLRICLPARCRRSEAGLVIAADKPVQRSAESQLLHVDAAGRIRSVPRALARSSCCGPATS